MGTQKNRLNETVLLSIQTICLNWWVRKYLQFYAEYFCLSKPVINFQIYEKTGERGKYCNTSAEEIVLTSFSNKIYVHFASRSDLVIGSGFRLEYVHVDGGRFPGRNTTGVIIYL